MLRYVAICGDVTRCVSLACLLPLRPRTTTTFHLHCNKCLALTVCAHASLVCPTMHRARHIPRCPTDIDCSPLVRPADSAPPPAERPDADRRRRLSGTHTRHTDRVHVRRMVWAHDVLLLYHGCCAAVAGRPGRQTGTLRPSSRCWGSPPGSWCHVHQRWSGQVGVVVLAGSRAS